MNNTYKRKLFEDAIMGLKSVENLFGAHVLQKDAVQLTKEEETLFCEICNDIQKVMQCIHDCSQSIQATEVEQIATDNHPVCDRNKRAIINYILCLPNVRQECQIN